MTNIKKFSMVVVGLSLMTLGTTLASPSAALAVVIDFDSLSDGEVVGNQFLSLGVDFKDTGSILQQGLSLSSLYPPISGKNVIYNNPSLKNGTIRIDAIDSLWSSVGGFVTGNTSVTLTAYSSDNSILGGVLTGGANFDGADTEILPNVFLSLSTVPNISYVTFQNSASFTLDNFTFVSKPVPEPTTMLGTLLASAALGANFLRKSKRQQVATKS